jgi:hypothetical protein
VKQWPLRARNRQVHERERADHLRLPILEHLKVVARRSVTGFSGRVADERIDLDEVGLDAERQRRLPVSVAGAAPAGLSDGTDRRRNHTRTKSGVSYGNYAPTRRVTAPVTRPLNSYAASNR